MHHEPSGRSISYGKLAGHAAHLVAPTDVPLKDPPKFRLLGKAARRLDTPGKVNGSAKFGIDATMPGLRFATFAASPVFGGKLRHVDDGQARAVPGVRQVVVLDDKVAVAADHMWAAMQGLRPWTSPGTRVRHRRVTAYLHHRCSRERGKGS